MQVYIHILYIQHIYIHIYICRQVCFTKIAWFTLSTHASVYLMVNFMLGEKKLAIPICIIMYNMDHFVQLRMCLLVSSLTNLSLKHKKTFVWQAKKKPSHRFTIFTAYFNTNSVSKKHNYSQFRFIVTKNR